MQRDNKTGAVGENATTSCLEHTHWPNHTLSTPPDSLTLRQIPAMSMRAQDCLTIRSTRALGMFKGNCFSFVLKSFWLDEVAAKSLSDTEVVECEVHLKSSTIVELL